MNYKEGTTTLKGVSVNFYAGDKRASDACVTNESALVKSVSFSKDVTDISDITIASVDKRKSVTVFTGEQGEEIADYSMNYKEGTTTLKGVSVNFYAGDKRASDASVTNESALVKSVSFSKDVTDISDITIASVDKRKSVTVFTGEQGEEIADYSMNYKEGTTTLKGVSVNFYAGDKRASDASVTNESALVKSVSFSKDVTDISDITIASVDKRKSVTVFTGEQGEEIADYSMNYKEGTTTLKGVSVNFYAGDKRASDTSVTNESALVKSVSFSKDVTDISDITIASVDKRKSVTVFTGEQGEEIADYSMNYK